MVADDEVEVDLDSGSETVIMGDAEQFLEVTKTHSRVPWSAVRKSRRTFQRIRWKFQRFQWESSAQHFSKGTRSILFIISPRR